MIVRFRRRTISIALAGAITALALATVVAVVREMTTAPASSLAGGPVTEVAPEYKDRPRRIFDVPLRKKKDAARSPALLARDSDGDGYSNEVELIFGSMPGRRNSHPARPAIRLERWRAIIVRQLRGKQIARLERDPRVRRVGPDTDGDRVPDVLERLVGSDARIRNSTPLVAARRLAVYRQVLLDAGVPIR
jgi:hypothetical protein